MIRRLICWIIFRLFNRPVNAAKFLGVKIGDNCKILDDPWKVFGSEPYLISIGDNVEITNGVRFCTHDGAIWVLRYLIGDEYKKADKFGEIIIGNNVFIGINTIIMPNVYIGDNVIVGSGSIVTKNLTSNKVFAGNPAHEISDLCIYEEKNKSKIIYSHNYSKRKKRRLLKELVNKKKDRIDDH